MFGAYHFGWSGLSTLTDGRYRYIKAPREELYDLQRDPGEHENLADQRPDPRRSFREKLKGFAASPPPVMAAPLDRRGSCALRRAPESSGVQPNQKAP